MIESHKDYIRQKSKKLKKYKRSVTYLQTLIAKQHSIISAAAFNLDAAVKNFHRAAHSEQKLPAWAKMAVYDTLRTYNILADTIKRFNGKHLLNRSDRNKINKIYKKVNNAGLISNTLPRIELVNMGKSELKLKPITNLYIATNNTNKFQVFQYMLKDTDLVLTPQYEVSAARPVKEDAECYQGNSDKKAIYLSKLVKGWVIADDSGLEVDLLDGKPGVLSNRYAGDNSTDEDNIKLLLSECKNLRALEPIKATYKCTLSVAYNGYLVTNFTGEMKGTISFNESGNNGWSYDRIFIPEGFERCGTTIADMALEQQAEISHRAIAIRRFITWFKQVSW